MLRKLHRANIVILTISLISFHGVWSWSLLRDGILKDGTCLLFGNFLTNDTSIDPEVLQDQVMIQVATWHIFDSMREFVWLRLQMNNDNYMMFKGQPMGLQAFIEDTIKDGSCILLVQGSNVEIPRRSYNKVQP